LRAADSLLDNDGIERFQPIPYERLSPFRLVLYVHGLLTLLLSCPVGSRRLPAHTSSLSGVFYSFAPCVCEMSFRLHARYPQAAQACTHRDLLLRLLHGKRRANTVAMTRPTTHRVIISSCGISLLWEDEWAMLSVLTG